MSETPGVMDSQDAQDVAGGRRRGNLFWWVLLLILFAVWWYWRRPADNGVAAHAPTVSELAYTDPDDVLVDLADDVSDADVARIEGVTGLDLELVSDQAANERLYRAHLAPGVDRDAVLARLAGLAGVDIAEPDAEMSLSPWSATESAPDDDAAWKGYPNDPQFKHQWHMRQIGMPAAWRLADGKGVIVAVIDTGVAYEDFQRFHRVPDLAGVGMAPGFDFVKNTAHANDDHGHGTHVAGTIAQATHNGVGVAGIAPHAIIMPLKVLSASGSGSVAAIADAIHFAADNGAKVINMSLGGPFPSKILAKAVKYARDKGVVVVCAAGNDGRGRVSYPAAYPGSFAVAATQFDEATTFYSNWGKEIDVAAPGGNTQVDQDKDGRPDGVLQNTIVVGDPSQDGYFAFMGTSMASPHVAGVAALLVSAGVTQPDAVEALLKKSARAPKDRKLEATRYGAGIIDAPAALKASKGASGAQGLAVGLTLLGAVATLARRRAVALLASPGALAGVVIGAGGLGALALFGLALPGAFGVFQTALPEWGLVLGLGAHGSPLLFSAVMPLALIAFAYGVPRLRAPMAGLAAGVAAALVVQAFSRTVDVHWVPAALEAAWLALNAALLAGLATLVLRR